MINAEERQKRNWATFAATLALAFLFFTLPIGARAQAKGDNVVWANSTVKTGTTAAIDAAAWCNNGDCTSVDFCTMVNDAITQGLPSGGGVIDARGVVRSDGKEIPCNGNPFPQSNTVPVTLLLPSSVITVHATWVLPSNTKVIGEGRKTILQATSPFTPDSSSPVEAMIEMGNASLCSSGCNGISVEHLKLDGNNLNVPPNGGLTGIYNGNATDGSYVSDVNFVKIGAISGTQSSLTTGLLIDVGATGSGPYSQLDFSGGSSTNCSGQKQTCLPTACVQIRAATRGLHSITCTAASSPGSGPAAGIYLDASNNTIEDVHSEGFYDAIVLGDDAAGLNATVSGNVISNVTGNHGGSKTGPTTNAIHICSPQSAAGSPSACASGTSPITDISIFQAESIGSASGNFTAHTIQDDLTGTTVNGTSSAHAYVGMYVLGESMATSQYSRFTTAASGANGSTANLPTWAAGSSTPATTSCTTPGALYSNKNGTGSGINSTTLYVCTGSPSPTWQVIANQ